MKVVVIGAGRVGCGNVGHVFTSSGHDVIFVNRGRGVVERINQHRGYAVRLCDGPAQRKVIVGEARALWMGDRTRVTDVLSRADLIVTAVGVGQLHQVAPLVAAGLRRAARPVNVVAVENAIAPGAQLRAHVSRQLERRWATRRTARRILDRHGFSSGLALQIVAARMLDPDSRVPLTFLADSERRLVVDGRELVRPLEPAAEVVVSMNYPAWVRGKLYTFNAAHAAAAYLGDLKGYRFVHAAVRDPEIRPVVAAIARAGRAGVLARYGKAASLTTPTPGEVLRRLGNAALDDSVARVARDPLRKLGRTERLVGPAVLAAEAGLCTAASTLAMAAALRYTRVRGVSAAPAQALIRDVCGLDPDRGTGRSVTGELARLDTAPDTAMMLSLRSATWAWRRPATRPMSPAMTGGGAA